MRPGTHSAIAFGASLCATWLVAAGALAAELAPLSPQEWRVDPLGWRVGDNVIEAESLSPSFAVWRGAPVCGAVTVEATVTPQAITGDGWKFCGIAIYESAASFWNLAVNQSPNASGSANSLELSEMRAGKWLAQRSLKALADEGSRQWTLGAPLRMRLELRAGRIDGWIRDAAGALVIHRAYELAADSTRAGRPALRVAGVRAAFADVRAAWADPRAADAAGVKPSFPPYAASAAASGIRGKPTGFFHVEQIDSRWWIVDPLGDAMLALGIDHVNYQGPYCTALGYSPYGRANDKKYASPAVWEEQSLDRLRSWSFNLLAAGCQPTLYRRGLAYCLGPSLGQRFTTLGGDCEICPNEKHPGSSFPNVFHPKFREWCEYQLEEMCSEGANDPWLFGYFLDNELAWWGRRRDVGYGLFDAVMKKLATHSAKTALRDFLRSKYSAIEQFNAAWSVKLAAFDDILNLDALGADDNQNAAADKDAFVALIADRYFGIITGAIRKFDPNHMILGCRFAGGNATDAVWAACGRYCDIGSFNYYGSVDLDRGLALGGEGGGRMDTPLADVFRKFHERCGRPLMITEWSFPALDAGLPSTKGAGQRFRTQPERAEATEIYLTAILRMPFMAGSDYFKWTDQPALGITPEFPENSNYGVVNDDDRPYALLTAALQRVQQRAIELHRSPDAAPSAASATAVAGPEYQPGQPWAGRSTWRAPITVFNATRAPLREALVIAQTLTPAAPRNVFVADTGDAIPGIVASDGEQAFVAALVENVAPGETKIVFARDGARTRLVPAGPTPPLRFERKGSGFVAANGALTVASEDPGDGLTSSISIGGLALGKYNAMIQQSLAAGKKAWLPCQRLTDAHVHWGDGCMAVDLTGESSSAGAAPGAQPYAISHRLILFADRPWFVAQLLWARNTGAAPLEISGWYFRVHSFIRGDAKDDTPTSVSLVPRLWKAEQQSAWGDPAGGFLGIVSPREEGRRVRFWLDPNGGQHPDATQETRVTIAPGDTFYPADPVWVLVAGGDGLEDAWERLAQELTKLTAARTACQPIERR